MKNIPWTLVALLGIGAYLYWKRASIMNAPRAAGEAISRTIFDTLHPSLSPEEFNKPTIISPVNGKCPDGYVYRVGKSGPYCARVS